MTSERGLQIVIALLLCLFLAIPSSAALGITGINPSSGLNTGTVFITNLSGTDFPDQDYVSVSLNRTGQDNITGQYVTVVTPTRITCVFDLTGRKAGLWDVVVINTTSGESAVLPDRFQVENPDPQVTSITPTSGENDDWVEITDLAGSNFLPNVTVNLTRGSTVIPGVDVSRVSASKITCRFNTTFAEPGLYNVTVTNDDGKSATLTNGFLVRYPRPAVTAIFPASGTNNQVIGITNLSGSGFMPGANVSLRRSGHGDIPTINGAIVESSGKILCFFNLNGVHVGKWDVVVTNLDGQNGTLPEGFTVYYPETPSVLGISPSGGVNTGPIAVNVTGSGFHQNATVFLKKESETIPGTGVFVYSGSAIGAIFNLTGRSAGTYDVTVVNEDGQESTKAEAFTVTNPPPTVLDVAPPSGTNTQFYSLVITGTGFLPGPTVTFSKGTTSFDASSATTINSTRIDCMVNLAGKEAGIYNVTVTNTDGLSGTKAAAFTIQNPAPVIHAIDPSTGQNTGPVENVILKGENFLPGAGVNLTRTGETAIPGIPVTWINATALSCTFDLTGKTAGAWTVEVTNPDGKGDEYPGLFTITNPPPHPENIVPNTGPNNGPVGITGLTGSGFLAGASVKLSRSGQTDIPGTGVDVNVTTQTIMCFFNLNGAAVGYWDVVVTNTDTQSGTLPQAFFVRYPAAPAVTGIDPGYAPNDGPVAITNLSGSGFQNGATVKLTRASHPDIVATDVTVVNQGMITCTFNLTGAEPGSWDVVVTNDDDQSGTLPSGFEVRYPAPSVTAITPNKGNNNQIVTITDLSGSNFRNGATVRLVRTSQPDINATNVTVVNPGRITCSLNLNGMAVGEWDVVVTNTDGQSGSKANGFTIEYPAPVVSSTSPNRGPNDGLLQITAISGNYFRNGATVTLTKSGQAPIVATNVQVINATTLNCTVDLRNRQIGQWNVVVTNTDGKYGTLPLGFQVIPPLPVPDFTASPTYGTVPLTVTFTDLSRNNPSSWIWDFGDGSMSGVLDRNPVHTYNAVGTYNVSLTVFNDGGSASIRKDSYIVVVKTPVADFTATPTSGNAPLLVQFRDTSDGNPTQWFWNFGDGAISIQQNPYHLYTRPGVYNVTLGVRNSAGSNSVTKEGLITVMAVPVADFSANRTTGSAPLAVQFRDLSSGYPSSWLWTFGDGMTSTEQSPVHVYSMPGVYTVRLTVTNSAGTDTKTRSGFITVVEGLSASFTYTPSNPENLAPLTVAFTDTSGGSPTNWVWNFGDGRMATERNPIHTYPTPGNYTVTLTVSDAAMRSSSASQVIEVRPRLVADFEVQPGTGSAPLTVRLVDRSIGTPNSWTWIIFRDALNVTIFDPGSATETYTFNEPGSYDIRLTVTDAYGNTDSVMKSDIVQVIPFP
ncbi:MAG: PKD domain-containing protein [Methanolinea sp.]|nr:PKD domain-containing protein [Methanolinea sp.]